MNGILFSILTRNAIKEAAKEINLLENLEELREKLDDRFQQQIDFIVEQTNKEEADELEESFEEEEDADNNFGQEDDFFDDVLSENDPNSRTTIPKSNSTRRGRAARRELPCRAVQGIRRGRTKIEKLYFVLHVPNKAATGPL